MTFPTKRWRKKLIGYSEETVLVVSPRDWFRRGTIDVKRNVIDYFVSLFPILGWIRRYNLGWLTGDIIAGLTVGMVSVPQSMSCAQIATLPPQYGLYASFIGAMTYCLFATSKDVSIGPVAVMSLTVAQIIKFVQHKHPHKWGGPEIATTLAFICGFISLGLGLLRLGWLVEFIPAPAVSGFMTGSAISIVAGQIPGLMGITGIDTRAQTYKVIIHSLQGLPGTKIDAAWGLSGLITLYIVRFACEWLGRRYPRRARLFFFISVLRNAFVLFILTIGAWLYARNRGDKQGKYPIRILKTVPRGFQHVGQPNIDPELLSTLAPKLPVALVILLLEHIAIAKSFGRVNNYTINPNQELIAIGVANTVGSCFAAYPSTGSFSRSALNAKSGVSTPAGGIISALVVVVALYGLTTAFYWIPAAGLSAVIIHAVADLVASPSQVFSFWRVSPLEFFIWVAAVLVTVFSSIENGVYTSIAASLLLLLIRVAHPRGHFLGKVTLRNQTSSRDVYLPLNQGSDGKTNVQVKVTPPIPGVIVYRLEESYVFPNSSRVNSALVNHVKETMRRGIDVFAVKPADRLWNDAGPSRGSAEQMQQVNLSKPDLHAIVLDFSAISQIDMTGVQSLIDTRNVVEKWADHPVEFHFATILSPWIRRALIAGGFGTGSLTPGNLAEVAAANCLDDHGKIAKSDVVKKDTEAAITKRKSASSFNLGDTGNSSLSEDTPFFHLDLAAAVRAAESGVAEVWFEEKYDEY